MVKTPTEPRKYDSPLRKAQSERTAELIIEAAAQEISENGMADLSMPRVAERAGVAVRTLYRHFATREDLLTAIGERLERDMIGSGPPLPASADGIVTTIPELFAYFDQNAEAVEAMHATRVGRQIRKVRRARRDQRIHEVASTMYEGFSPRQARLAFAMLRAMFGSATWLTFRKEIGLDGEESQDAVRWMAEMYVREMKRLRRQIERAKEKKG